MKDISKMGSNMEQASTPSEVNQNSIMEPSNSAQQMEVEYSKISKTKPNISDNSKTVPKTVMVKCKPNSANSMVLFYNNLGYFVNDRIAGRGIFKWNDGRIYLG